MQNALFSDDASSPAQRQDEASPLTVSALNRLARGTLERNLPLLRVTGEISNLVRAPSGHLYLTLKDDAAQVRCVMWRSRAQRMPLRIRDGMQVEVRALVTLYEVRGDFQLNLQEVRQAGIGNLYEAFLRLREMLADEGLFGAEHKRPLPRFPKAVGIVTSPAAAALRDVLATLERRAPGIRIVLYPAQVQGASAAVSLTNALKTASDRATQDGLDAIVLVRGGGSLEDLWGFNDEGLARTIALSSVPVVSGVGHETDVTIADLVADLRATTPTMAAELVSAGYFESRKRLDGLQTLLLERLQNRLNTAQQRLDRAALKLVHPQQRLDRYKDQLGQLQIRLAQHVQRRLEHCQHTLTTLSMQIRAQGPDTTAARMQLTHLAQRLSRASHELVPQRRERLTAMAAHLEHLSPLATLSRGFSITRNECGCIVRTKDQVSPGEAISVQLSQGKLKARIEPDD